MLRSKFVKFLMPIFKRQVDSSPNFVFFFLFMKDNSSVLFLAQRIYNLLKRSTLKCKFLRLSSALVKIHQIPHINFEMRSQFFFKFSVILSCFTQCFTLCSCYMYRVLSHIIYAVTK